MGRMLEAMNRITRQASLEDGAAAETNPEPHHDDASSDSADTSEEVPFIEVGGRGKAVDASPSVLQGPSPMTMESRLSDLAAPRSPMLTEAVHRRFIFRPMEAAVKTGRVAGEIIAFHDATH